MISQFNESVPILTSRPLAFWPGNFYQEVSMVHHPKSASERASFRFAAISLVKAKVGSGVSQWAAIAETVTLMKQGTLSFGISKASLYRWLSAYEKRGFAGLEEKPPIREHSALPERFLAYLETEKCSDPDASIPEIIRRAKALGVVTGSERIDRTTAYRHARRLNLPLPKKKKTDSTKRPFAYPHRMQMVLCDGKHFRAGPRRQKRMAYFFLDDATRYILGVVVGTSENSCLFLRGLFEVIAQHGLMDAIYLDKGPGFIAKDAEKVAQKLGVPFIFGATRYPEGHGKIERFNQTLKAQCLRGLDKPEINPALASLKIRLDHFASQVYATAKHEALGMSPGERFFSDTKSLRFYEDSDRLRRCFLLTFTRKVREDNCISHNMVIYEVPLGYASTRVTIYHDFVQNEIFMLHDGRSIKLAPPDLAQNARDGVKRSPSSDSRSTRTPVTTAAEIQFNKDMRPIVDSDGGYTSPFSERDKL